MENVKNDVPLDDNYIIIRMPKAKDFWIGVLTGLGLAGGAWLIANEIRKRTKIVYRCSNCNEKVNKYENPCHNCKTNIDWEGIDESE